MQFSHRSQPLWTSTATRSPTLNSSTPGPSAATVPAYSWPITNSPAGCPWSVRWSTFTSVPQIDATSTFSRTSPGPGSGRGQGWTRMSSAPWRTTAFMLEDVGMGTSWLDGIIGPKRQFHDCRPSFVDAFVWTGQGSPMLADRTKRLPEYQSKNRRPIRPRLRAQHLHARSPGDSRRRDRGGGRRPDHL